MRPRRKATVTQAVIRAISGQLIQASKALEIERAVIRACGEDPPTRDSLARLSPARLTACGLAASRAATLTRLSRSLDLEGLRTGPDALERLGPDAFDLTLAQLRAICTKSRAPVKAVLMEMMTSTP